MKVEVTMSLTDMLVRLEMKHLHLVMQGGAMLQLSSFATLTEEC